MSETIIQIISAILYISYALLEGSASMWLWPVGVLSPIFALIVGWQSQTYSTMLVQLYYLAGSIVGWITWHRKRGESREAHHPHIGYLSLRRALLSAAVTAVAFVALRFTLETFSPYPAIEAAGTALCILGMYLLIKARVEAWYTWIVANILYMTLYFLIPGYSYTGVLYLVLTLLSVRGLAAWRRKAKEGGDTAAGA